jgi:SAM-dependent methyltransferase
MKQFGESYFDSGRSERGQYVHYSYESRYPYFQLLAKNIERVFQPRKVLDLGCAKGFLVLAFHELGIEAYGVDISEYAISKAPSEIRDHLRHVDLGHDALPFSASSFDLVMSLGVLEYILNFEHVIEEARRILLNGGLFVMLADYFPGRDELRVNVRSRDSWLESMRNFGFSYLPDEGLSHSLRRKQLEGLYSEAARKGKILRRLPRGIAIRLFVRLNESGGEYLFFRLNK